MKPPSSAAESPLQTTDRIQTSSIASLTYQQPQQLTAPTTIAGSPIALTSAGPTVLTSTTGSTNLTSTAPANLTSTGLTTLTSTGPTALTSTAPTALVIIPQHSSTIPVTQQQTKVVTATNHITTNLITTNLSSTTQSTPIQLQAPITTHIPSITTVPLTAHQQTATVIQPTLTTRPPLTLPVISTGPANAKAEHKNVCCLMDNGMRCERFACNASFSARIQKIVATKSLNFALDPTARHTYICEHHKAVITVAKKSTALTNDTKSNARNYTASKDANTLAPQYSSPNEFSAGQQSLQQPMNLKLVNHKNRILVPNHGTSDPQVAHGNFKAARMSQVGFVGAGGDNIPSSSGGVDVDLQQLQVNTLRRYKRHFRVQTKPGLNKMQLAESLKSHFRTMPIIEKEAITYFVYIVKCYRNKLDYNPRGD